MADPPRSPSLYEAIGMLRDDGSYSDLIVSCGSYEYKLHKAIVCSQSPFFRAACAGGFKESVSGHIDLPADDPQIFVKFIEVLYTGNYADEANLNPKIPAAEAMLGKQEIEMRLKAASNQHSQWAPALSKPRPRDLNSNRDAGSNTGNTTPPSLALLTSVKVYVMADKFLVPSLKLVAREQFSLLCQHHFDSKDFLAAVRKVYATTVALDLREICCRSIAQHYSGAEMSGFHLLMRKNGDLATGVLHHVMLNGPVGSKSAVARNKSKFGN